MKLFTESRTCRVRNPDICAACRDRGPAGQSFRAGLAGSFSLPVVVDDAGVWACPRRVSEQRLPPVPAAPDPGQRDKRTRKLWDELHRRALAYTGDVGRERQWLDAFARRVPCGECRQHWREMVKAAPPDLSSAEAFFAWTVTRHNDVNRRLAKREWGVDEARAALGSGGPGRPPGRLNDDVLIDVGSDRHERGNPQQDRHHDCPSARGHLHAHGPTDYPGGGPPGN